MSGTKLADVIVPAKFTGYAQQRTTEKSLIIQAGIVTRDSELDGLLAGGGKIFDSPSFNDLANDEENVADDTGNDSVAKKIETLREAQIRLSRNQSWKASDISGQLAGADPMTAIGNLVGDYWVRRLQALFIATWSGIFKMNAANPTAASSHSKGDMIVDIAGTGASAVTTAQMFGADHVIDTSLTMGDSIDQLGLMVVHSVIYGRMQKQNLIAFIPDARGEVRIPTYLGHRVVVDNGVPNYTRGTNGKCYETWFFGAGTSRLGVGSPKVPTAVTRDEKANNGSGEEVLHNRIELCLHPVGHRFNANASGKAGGPSNAVLGTETTWTRSFTERNQIRAACLITRENA